MRAMVFMLLASCVGSRGPVFPHYVPIFFSPADGQWHVTPICDGLPMMDRTGAITGCFGEWRPPVYECAAEDGSGRTVRAIGDPVQLSEGLADEPGGLWSCYPAPRTELHRGSVHADAATLGNAIPKVGESSISEGAPVSLCSPLSATIDCELCPDLCGRSPLAVPDDPGCDPPNIIPSIICGEAMSPRFDGCHWGCAVGSFTVTPLSAPVPASQPSASAANVLISLSLAASANRGATCAISAWAPLSSALEACE